MGVSRLGGRRRLLDELDRGPDVVVTVVVAVDHLLGAHVPPDDGGQEGVGDGVDGRLLGEGELVGERDRLTGRDEYGVHWNGSPLLSQKEGRACPCKEYYPRE